MAEKKKILIVEDEKAMLDLLKERIEAIGFDVIEAKNGAIGFEAARDQNPDLILLDILMPKMDGITMMKKVREESWGKEIPIVILTNLSPSDSVMAAVARDEPAFYLIKTDWQLDEIMEKIKSAIKNGNSN